jgi:hypothetical protein
MIMKSLRSTAQQDDLNAPISIRAFMRDYGTNSLSTLFARVAFVYGEVESLDLPGNYTFTKQKSGGKNSLRVQSKDNSSVVGVDVPDSKLGSEKSEQASKDIAKKVFEYFAKNYNDIRDGKIKAAEIGAAIYGIAAAVILAIFTLPFSPILGAVFIPLASNVGKYYGSIVDAIVAVLKGEDNLQIAEIVGIMATLYFLGSYYGPIVALFGADGWSITRKVGEEVGGVLEDGVNEITSVVELITGISLGDVADEAGKFIEDVF